MYTTDKTIRKELNSQLHARYGNDPDSIIINEFDVNYGEARVDVILINGEMHGYEIKSDRDTLRRLENQIQTYNKTFDRVTIVAGEKHINDVLATVPEWWGIKMASINASKTLDLVDIREPKVNSNVKAESIVRLLWRAELLELIDRYGAEKGIKQRPIHILWGYVAEHVPLEDLKTYVRKRLKWRYSTVYGTRRSDDG